MDIRCPRCDARALFAGNEDARYFYQCEKCSRVWSVIMTAPALAELPPRMRVLVVDDSDQLVGLIGSWLEDDGYSVMTATTGRLALDCITVQAPEIVLLDLIMPRPDGFDVCAALQLQPQPPQVLLMTGVSDPSHLQRAIDCGASAVLRKPLTQEAVLEVVATAARRVDRRMPRHVAARG